MSDKNQRTVGVSNRRVRRVLRIVLVMWLVGMLLVAPAAGVTPSETAETSAAGTVYQDGEVNATACEFGPPIPGRDAEGDDVDLEVALVNDRSASMSNNGFTQPMKDASTAFVDRLNESDEAAAVSFGNGASVDQALTTDHQAVKDAINNLNTDDSSTDLAAGINTAHAELQSDDPGAAEAMVIVTDAGSFEGGDPVEAAADAKDDGIQIFTITLDAGDADTETMEEVASSPDDAYVDPDGSELDEIYQDISRDVESIQLQKQVRVDTRQLYQPGETHPYTVRRVTYEDNRSVWTNVTENSSVESSNETVLSVDESTHTMEATEDANTSTWVRVNATHNGIAGCTNVIVSQPTIENLQLVPGIWRIVAVANDATLFALLIATLLAVPAARFTSAFGGLAVAQMVVVVGWFAGYIGFGIAASSLFVALFIGLNLAANIQYTAGGGFR